MKSLIILGLALFTSSAFACTDFSGDYRTEENTYYSIEQNGCDSMYVVDETGANEMIFDGVERLLHEYDIEVEGAVLAHVQIYLKSEMKAEKWIYHERDVVTYRGGEVEEEKKWAEVSFNEDTDLLTVLHNQDGSTETYVDVRNR
ncbi:hypothetical protein DOM21_12725 [Bacteriovorax stolpii]|uniref:hypothetical protein n=1 Tax=Bacteriovorax stolpii TaxID=960 RepID=UPI001157D43E|nr:hypothetical protein [Bacteriovorax stolpii]QDK42291.1 hypothetical protein DOM21_12725 [Bacteriovorax stolpii]